jgi:hypothetical protein
LVTDRLNVIGENHIEDADNLENEKKVSTAMAGGGYWDELTFMTTAGITGGGTKEITADPPTLQFLSKIDAVKNLTKEFSGAFGSKRHAIFAIKAHVIKPKIDGLITKAKNNFDNLKDLTSPGVLTSGEFGRIEPRLKALEDLQTALTELASVYADGKDYTSTDKVLIKTKYDAIVTAREKMTEDMMPESDLHLLRSKAMHEAAQQQAGKKGIWKIGDLHVNEIKAIPGAEPRYNLITREEFYRDIIPAAKAAGVWIEETEPETPAPTVAPLA